MPNWISGQGPFDVDLMIVGEFPGRQENESGQVFQGISGEILNQALFKAGLTRHDCYLTYVYKYQPPYNDPKKYHHIGIDTEKEIEYLWKEEIEKLKPKCILAIGEIALNAITHKQGIKKYRGSILTCKDGMIKVVPTLHPSVLFSKGHTNDEEYAGGMEYTYIKLIEHDINRAVEESKTRDLVLPDRSLFVAHSSLDVERFFREYSSLDLAASDIESINCIPVCTGFAFNRNHAISIPLLRSIGRNQLTDMSIREVAACWRIIDEQYRRLRIIGHNFKYDEYKLSLSGFYIPRVHSDTIIKTRVIFPEFPEVKLGVVSSVWTREPFYKDDGKDYKFGKSAIENFFIYNARDCAVEFEVDEAQEIDLIELGEYFNVPLKSYYYDYMMKKHKLYLKFERNGKRVDLAAQSRLLAEYTGMQEVVHERLIENVGHEINVASPPQVGHLLYEEMKFKRRKIDPTSEDSIVALLEGTKKKLYQDILNDILQERRIRNQKSRQISFHPDYDGRCRSSYNISATETCRSSTGILKKPLRPRKIGLADHTISQHGKLAKDIKTMFLADEGRVIVAIDSSQAEARIVAVLSKDWDLLAAFDSIDIHRRTAGLILGLCDKLELSAAYKNELIDAIGKDSPERFCGKKTRHAGNYYMKKRRFKTEFNTDAQKFGIQMSISEWKAEQMLKLFHAASPNIRSVFHAEIEEAINTTRSLVDPFGGPRIFNGQMNDSLYQEGYANIPQRSVAHLIQGAAIAADEIFQEDVNFMWSQEKHDALYFQAPENNWEPYAKVVRDLMQRPIDFSTYCTLKRDIQLVIPADVEISHTHYADFKKVKLAS